MTDELNDILETYGSNWVAIDDCILETCCGDSVEWDCAQCPSCQEKNPLMRLGLV